MQALATLYTNFCENHLYNNFPESKPLPFNYRSKNKVVYWDDKIAVLENENQFKYGHNNCGFRFLVPSNYESKSDLGLLQSILDYTWSCSSVGYPMATSLLLARTFGCNRKVTLHAFILGRLGVKDNLVVDHIDRHRYNNTFQNLRVVGKAENVRNREITDSQHPNIYWSENLKGFRVMLVTPEKSIFRVLSSLDEAMLFFDFITLKQNLNYGLYFDHSYGCFYSDFFLFSRGILVKEDILKSVNFDSFRQSKNQYQNITWSVNEGSFRLQIAKQGYKKLVKIFRDLDEALAYRERYFIEYPQFINTRTICYSKNLELMKGLFYPNVIDLNIVYHSDPKFKKL